MACFPRAGRGETTPRPAPFGFVLISAHIKNEPLRVKRTSLKLVSPNVVTQKLHRFQPFGDELHSANQGDACAALADASVSAPCRSRVARSSAVGVPRVALGLERDHGRRWRGRHGRDRCAERPALRNVIRRLICSSPFRGGRGEARGPVVGGPAELPGATTAANRPETEPPNKTECMIIATQRRRAFPGLLHERPTRARPAGHG